VKWLVSGLVVLVASVTVALVALPDPGYVLIGYGKYSLETTLAAFVIALGLAYLAVRMIAGLWHAPRGIRRWNDRYRNRRLGRLFDTAMIELVEGQPERAERRLARLVYAGESPLDVYLSAARVANRIDADDRRDYYLKLALERYPRAELAIGLVQAELQLSRSQLDQAQTTLSRLQSLSAHNAQVMRLRIQLYLRQQDWEALRGLLPELRRGHVLAGDQWQRLAVQVYRQRLEELGAMRDLEALESGWKQLPSAVQQDQAMVSVYLQELLRIGAHAQAEQVLREQLRVHWDRGFVYAYGDVAAPNAAGQLSVAEGWLEQHPDDGVLLLTLGKISLRNELWGKARGYFESGIEREPMPEAYRLLGSLLERLGEADRAAECYRKGIELMDKAMPGRALRQKAQSRGAALLDRPA
jgi:HemY protein